jgi:hypothetical protein
LSEDDFWRLTLAQYFALINQYTERQAVLQEREDYRTAIIASSILNTIPRTKKNRHKVFTPADIFPGYNWRQVKDYENIPEKTPEKRFEHYLMLTKLMNGKITEKVYDEGNS